MTAAAIAWHFEKRSPVTRIAHVHIVSALRRSDQLLRVFRRGTKGFRQNNLSKFCPDRQHGLNAKRHSPGHQNEVRKPGASTR